MAAVKVLGEFFFSQVQGARIYDPSGRLVGRVFDMAVRWDGISPQVSGIKFAKGVQNHLDIDQIDEWNDQGLRLKGPIEKDKLKQLQLSEIYVGKWLLDKQIIDLKGSKLVRVNDIKLSWVKHRDTADIFLVAVDIGLRGLFRRLGLERLVIKRPQHLVGWQYIKPIENKTANLQLSREQTQMTGLHPVDIAEIIEELDHLERADFLDTLDNRTAAEAIAEADLETQVEIIERMDSERASDILEELPPDEAADILGELTEEKSAELLNLMEPEEAEDVRELMSYEEGSAGALMTTEFISFSPELTAGETIDRLRELAPAAETIYYLYVVDSMEVLQGVVSLRELIIAQPATLLREIMSTRVVRVDHHDNDRKVLELVAKYNLLAVPVVDEKGIMLGIITIDDVIDELVPDRGNLETFSKFIISKPHGKGWRE